MRSTVPRLPRPAVDRRVASRRTCTACSRSPRRRSTPAAGSRSSAGRWCSNVALGREMGLLDVPVDRVIDIEEVPRYAPGEVCIICTGSQGEPMSALSLMAAHEHKYVKISERRRRRDLRARDPRQRVQRLPRHRLAAPRRRRGDPRRQRAGARVGPRVAGGAEVPPRPRAAGVVRAGARRVPAHGAPRAPGRGGRRAPTDHVLVCEDGDVLTLELRRRRRPTGIDVERRAVPAGYQYVDGIVGDVGHGVLRDRRNLAEEGLVVVIVTVDSTTGELVTGPEIVTRGWVYAPEAEELLEEAKAAVRASLAGGGRRGRHRLRDPPPPRPPVARQVHQRAHPPPPRDHPGRHRGLIGESLSARLIRITHCTRSR